MGESREPRTAAGRDLWLSMTGGNTSGPFGASARHLAWRIVAIEDETVIADRTAIRETFAQLVSGDGAGCDPIALYVLDQAMGLTPLDPINAPGDPGIPTSSDEWLRKECPVCHWWEGHESDCMNR